MADRSEQAQMLVNRIHKNARVWKRDKASRDVTCFRLYDRDIPEIPLAVDRYGERYLVTRYEAKHKEHTEDPGWFDDMCAAVQHAVGANPDAVHRTERQRQSGTSQYERRSSAGRRHRVFEGGLEFLVNLDDYLDTGLFLDHRITRGMVRAEARGKRFLNLFCYTGAFSVYAADGGAIATTSVDMSNTYLEWARSNMDLLGDVPGLHDFVRADVLAWLDDRARKRESYDLVLLDPPTFSNSKKMEQTLDILRDHPVLINKTLALLRPGGVLYFSSNARKLTLAEDDLIGAAEIEDITARTVPADFRNKRIHQCWRLVKG